MENRHLGAEGGLVAHFAKGRGPDRNAPCSRTPGPIGVERGRNRRGRNAPQTRIGAGDQPVQPHAQFLCQRAQQPQSADCVEKLRNQSVADFLRKPMKRNSRKALTTRQRMAARERM
ncbi:MAG: hypothetical protein GKR99_16045 [Rhodobacteraceae bacterium]|nr:hypothetical protein [Paracoccaceae bacterium]